LNALLLRLLFTLHPLSSPRSRFAILFQVALKYTLTSLAFPSGLFVALAQCVFAVVALTLLKALGKISFPDPSFANLRAVMPLPLIQVFNVGFGLIGTKVSF
jgi:hypothetical protein